MAYTPYQELMHFAFYEFSMLVTQRDFIQAERNVDSSLIDFLHYVSDSSSVDLEKVCDKRLQKLHANVQIIKDSAEMEAEFMKAEERERQIRDEGIKEGMKEYDRFMKLTQKLLSNKQYDELKRATEEKSYCQQLFEKYNIV